MSASSDKGFTQKLLDTITGNLVSTVLDAIGRGIQGSRLAHKLRTVLDSPSYQNTTEAVIRETINWAIPERYQVVRRP